MILGPQQSCYEGVLGTSALCTLKVNRNIHTVVHSAVVLTSCCAGGAFKLELFLPEDYPMAAPKVCTLWLELLILFTRFVASDCLNRCCE